MPQYCSNGLHEQIGRDPQPPSIHVKTSFATDDSAAKGTENSPNAAQEESFDNIAGRLATEEPFNKAAEAWAHHDSKNHESDRPTNKCGLPLFHLTALISAVLIQRRNGMSNVTSNPQMIRPGIGYFVRGVLLR
jgi:hypothetical protein